MPLSHHRHVAMNYHIVYNNKLNRLKELKSPRYPYELLSLMLDTLDVQGLMLHQHQ